MEIFMRKKGFTLIELLVVIAIIALLLAILMPALAKVKALARGLVCRTNVRQMTMGLKLYAQDNDEKVMSFDHAYGRYWFHEIAPYLGDQNFKDTAGETVSKVMEISYCPSAKTLKSGWGSATEPWRYTMGGSDTTGSYGMNLWLIPNGPGYGQIPTSEVDPVAEKNLFFQKIIDANPSITPTFGDCMWVGGWPRGDDPVPTNVMTGSTTKSMGRFAIDRHGKAINMGFVDGHVDKVPLEELWTLQWHKNFTPDSNITIDY